MSRSINNNFLSNMDSTAKAKQITSADAATTILVRSESCVLATYNVLITSAHTVEIYDDNQAGTQLAANLVMTIPASVVAQPYILNIALLKGLVLKVAASFAANHVITHRSG
jgi:hypothetical protein